MTRHAPVESIRWPFDSGSRGTKVPEFIRCVDGREPQMHEVWYLGFNGITREVHPTAQVDVGAGVVGEFTPD